MLSITLVVTSNLSSSYTDKVYDWTQQKDIQTRIYAHCHSLCMPPALIHITHATKLLHATQRIPSQETQTVRGGLGAILFDLKWPRPEKRTTRSNLSLN